MKQESPPGETEWSKQIPDDQWVIYQRVLQAVRENGINFALGGAFAVATYTGTWRNTKDMDIYIQPQDREKLIEIVTNRGLQDYAVVLPYDRNWIYRSYQGEYIVDIIWAMPNANNMVDANWLSGGVKLDIRGEMVNIVAPEEMIWGKIYVLQKDRCDWVDIVNIIYNTAERLDWEHLIARLEADLPLLTGVMAVFGWLSPDRSQLIPDWVWERLNLKKPEPVHPSLELTRQRAYRLDSRPWFRPVL
jgi:hypothetical protein